MHVMCLTGFPQKFRDNLSGQTKGMYQITWCFKPYKVLGMLASPIPMVKNAAVKIYDVKSVQDQTSILHRWWNETSFVG